MKFFPRNDGVIFERVKRGQTPSGIIMPDKSLVGVDHVVRAIGPKVEGLKVGDKVMVLGSIGADYGQLANKKGWFFTREANVAYIYEFDPEDFGETEKTIPKLPLPPAVEEDGA